MQNNELEASNQRDGNYDNLIRSDLTCDDLIKYVDNVICRNDFLSSEKAVTMVATVEHDFSDPNRLVKNIQYHRLLKRSS